MEKLLESILNQYPFDNPTAVFVRHGENKVYQVTNNNKLYILRIHQPIEGFSLALHQNGHSIKEYVQSEMDILSYLHNMSDIKVQKPIKTRSGELISFTEDGTPVTVLEWLEGNPIKLQDVTEDLAEELGELIALLHRNTETLNSYYRYTYDQDMVLRMIKELDYLHQNEELQIHHKDVMTKALNVVYETLNKLEEPKRLVHFDLGLSNLIINGNEISPIDFSLCGYGYKEMDISSVCANFLDVSLRKAVIKGYEEETHTKVDIANVENFFALGVMLYIITQFKRIRKDERFVNSMTRWETTILTPLINKESFLLTRS